MNFILLPLDSGFAESTAPPKLSVGAGVGAAGTSSGIAGAISATFFFSVGVSAISSALPADLVSRAGAGALAAALVEVGRAGAAAEAAMIFEEIDCGDLGDCAGALAVIVAIVCGKGFASSVADEAETICSGAAVAAASGLSVTTGVAADITGAGAFKTGGGICSSAASFAPGVADEVPTGVEAGAPVFAPSFLRSNPRATRRVPFACSTLMGLVKTRFAPMRNAFATPA